MCRFNSKFSCPLQGWDAIFSTAREFGLNMHGVSFHVGSGCGDLKPFADAVSDARDAFDLDKLFGPTCDSIDAVMPCTRLPEMRVGEWL